MDDTVELISRTGDGLYRLPAFIDAHVHVESSHLTPARFGRLIAAQGTLTAICDPHEIVNVMGEAGLDFMLADARRSPADDIRAAATHLASIGGGQCVVMDGKVLADLPLPIAGLMSASPAADVAARIEALKTAARQTGTALSDPFATLSFLALPVIPALKLTDRGLFAQ